MTYTQIYTGNGKGKTTCALGLAIRAYGANKKVYIAQFLKKGDFSEIFTIKNFLKGIVLDQFGSGDFILIPTKKEIYDAEMNFKIVQNHVLSGKFDLVILDELNCAVELGLIKESKVINLIKSKHEKTELVITGRNASENIMNNADLVTEMTEVKHYYNNGVSARKGIEF